MFFEEIHLLLYIVVTNCIWYFTHAILLTPPMSLKYKVKFLEKDLVGNDKVSLCNTFAVNIVCKKYKI